jgi:hypothetical protein
MPKEELTVSDTTAPSILRRGERWKGFSETVRVKRTLEEILPLRLPIARDGSGLLRHAARDYAR